jgi:hypothetical protein
VGPFRPIREAYLSSLFFLLFFLSFGGVRGGRSTTRHDAVIVILSESLREDADLPDLPVFLGHSEKMHLLIW